MFYHFDVTNDSELNDDELNSIEHLNDELCTDVFFQRCDHDGDHRFFSYEWCNCFQDARKLLNTKLIDFFFEIYFIFSFTLRII
jgi:hypothetical protein